MVWKQQHLLLQQSLLQLRIKISGLSLPRILEQKGYWQHVYFQSSSEYGKSYSKRNLQYFRKFYLAFPDEQIVNACVHNLNWTHFRSLLRVKDETARLWYMNEATQEGWSSRTLDRNIGTQYYYRLMQSPKKEVVENEMLCTY